MSGIHEISGRCHCGNIHYQFESPVPKEQLPIRRCDCSFCTRHGACYTSHPEGRLQVRIARRSQTSRYRFGSEAAEVLLCSLCGVYPLILAVIAGQCYAVLNANSIDELSIDRAALPPALTLENQSPEQRIARWQRYWIPQVQISDCEASRMAALLV